jgi:hypothetical protein
MVNGKILPICTRCHQTITGKIVYLTYQEDYYRYKRAYCVRCAEKKENK